METLAELFVLSLSIVLSLVLARLTFTALFHTVDLGRSRRVIQHGD
jgi:hypothetical protein